MLLMLLFFCVLLNKIFEFCKKKNLSVHFLSLAQINFDLFIFNIIFTFNSQVL